MAAPRGVNRECVGESNIQAPDLYVLSPRVLPPSSCFFLTYCVASSVTSTLHTLCPCVPTSQPWNSEVLAHPSTTQHSSPHYTVSASKTLTYGTNVFRSASITIDCRLTYPSCNPLHECMRFWTPHTDCDQWRPVHDTLSLCSRI